MYTTISSFSHEALLLTAFLNTFMHLSLTSNLFSAYNIIHARLLFFLERSTRKVVTQIVESNLVDELTTDDGIRVSPSSEGLCRTK